MERANDVGDHGFRRIVDAPALAFCGVVLGEEGFVEVDDGVAALALVVVAVEDAGGVGDGEHFGDVIHTPGELLGEVAEGDEAKQVAQHADGVRDVVEGRAAAEAAPARVRAANRPYAMVWAKRSAKSSGVSVPIR